MTTPYTPLSNPYIARFHAFDLLATLVAVLSSDGAVLFANAALEDALGTSRRTIEGSHFPDCFTEPLILQNALAGAGSNEFAALRYDAWLKRLNHEAEAKAAEKRSNAILSRSGQANPVNHTVNVNALR